MFSTIYFEGKIQLDYHGNKNKLSKLNFGGDVRIDYHGNKSKAKGIRI